MSPAEVEALSAAGLLLVAWYVLRWFLTWCVEWELDDLEDIQVKTRQGREDAYAGRDTIWEAATALSARLTTPRFLLVMFLSRHTRETAPRRVQNLLDYVSTQDRRSR